MLYVDRRRTANLSEFALCARRGCGIAIVPILCVFSELLCFIFHSVVEKFSYLYMSSLVAACITLLAKAS